MNIPSAEGTGCIFGVCEHSEEEHLPPYKNIVAVPRLPFKRKITTTFSDFCKEVTKERPEQGYEVIFLTGTGIRTSYGIGSALPHNVKNAIRV